MVIYIPLIPKFKTKVLSELLSPQTSHQPSSFVIMLIKSLVIYPLTVTGKIGEREKRLQVSEGKVLITKRRRWK